MLVTKYSKFAKVTRQQCRVQGCPSSVSHQVEAQSGPPATGMRSRLEQSGQMLTLTSGVALFCFVFDIAPNLDPRCALDTTGECLGLRCIAQRIVTALLYAPLQCLRSIEKTEGIFSRSRLCFSALNILFRALQSPIAQHGFYSGAYASQRPNSPIVRAVVF